MFYNLTFIIFETRTDQRVMNVSLELNYSVGCFFAFLTPVVINLGKGAILFTYWALAILTIATMWSIGPARKEK